MTLIKSLLVFIGILKNKHKGIIKYTGWLNKPWRLEYSKTQYTDLYPMVHQFLSKMKGKRLSQERTKLRYRLYLDKEKGLTLVYEEDKFIWIQKENGTGSNVGYFIESFFQGANAQKIKISITNTELRMDTIRDPKAFGVKYYGDGNSCYIPEKEVRHICKPGDTDCCIFLSVGPKGFSCEKFNSPTARTLLDRYAKKDIRASRIGNCVLLGRHETDPTLEKQTKNEKVRSNK